MIQKIGRTLSVLAAAVVAFGAQMSFALEPRTPEVLPGDIAGVYSSHDLKFQLFGPPPGIKHAAGVMRWRYNDANRPGSITKANAISQTQAAMSKWTAVCKISFVYDGETSVGFNTGDGNNVVGWDTNISAPTTGLTYVAWNGSNTITDAEIRLNANYTPGFDSTLVHEVGHALGLQHSDVNGAVMSGPPLSSYNGMASLGADDIAGCVSLYGTAGGGGGPLPDTTAPSVPTSLVAMGTSTTTIGLTWNASTDNVGVANYKVFRGNGTLLGTVTSPNATVASLAPGTSYSFTVSACDAAGNCSAQTSAASATTQSAPSADTQAPSVPTGLGAVAVSSSQINLSWNASTDNVGVTSYRVFRSGTQVGTTGSPSTPVTGLSASTLYTFTVAACDGAGNCSAQSAPASANTQAAAGPGPGPSGDTEAPSMPLNLVATTVNSSTITLAWFGSVDNSGGIVTYRVYRDGAFVSQDTVSNAAMTNLAASTTYTFTVQACDVAGNCSAHSPPATGSTTSGTGGPGPGPTANYQDLWWSPGQNGWGLTITQHNDALFIAMYIYDATGKPTWVVMSSGTWDASHTVYSGPVYIPAGSWFGAYDKNRFAVGTPAGTASFRFNNINSATVTYNINGLSGTKSIERLAFGVVDTTPITNYADAWWAGSLENGWGLVLSQQYRNLFAAWYTYDPNGQTTWFVMSSGTWTTPTTYTGKLYSTRGTQVLGANYNQAGFSVTEVGTLTLSFSGPGSGTMTYTVNGLTQTKSITRLSF
jgi:chitodextrinase